MPIRIHGAHEHNLKDVDLTIGDGLGPAVSVGQNLLNRNLLSTLASASGLHPFLRLLYARFGKRACVECVERVMRVYKGNE
ncbi:MAG: hypothetical protein LLG42_03355 [Chloroflexi bacterium]|nr:hypothetical protein [Chloroflexota bacterium]